jgi:hypothetical protein
VLIVQMLGDLALVGASAGAAEAVHCGQQRRSGIFDGDGPDAR